MNTKGKEQKTLLEKKEELLESLGWIEDEYEKLSFIIDMGKDCEPLPDEYRADTFRIEGCTSNLWLFPSFSDGRCFYQVDSDSAITKGIAAMLSHLYSGHKPDEILAEPPDFLSDIGIPQLLSPNRRNGLSNLSAKIKNYAVLCQEKYASS